MNSIFYRGEIGLAGVSIFKLRSFLRIPQQLWTTFHSEDVFLLLALILIMMDEGLAWLGCQWLSLTTKPGRFGFLKKSDLSPSFMVLFSTGFVDCGFCHKVVQTMLPLGYLSMQGGSGTQDLLPRRAKNLDQLEESFSSHR